MNKISGKNYLNELIEEAIVDCYNEEECRLGFLTKLQDFLQTPFEAKLGGKIVIVKNIDGDDRVIKAFIHGDQITYPVDILDLKINQKVFGYEWVAAYRKWETGKEDKLND